MLRIIHIYIYIYIYIFRRILRYKKCFHIKTLVYNLNKEYLNKEYFDLINLWAAIFPIRITLLAVDLSSTRYNSLMR